MLLFAVTIVHLAFSASWDYKQLGNDWDENTVPNSQCGTSNTQQSPINIVTNNVQFNAALTKVLQFNYPTVLGGKVVNNGHSFTYRLPALAKGSLPIFTGGISTPGQEWCLEQFHFHKGSTNTRGSEHLIDNKQYPVELHFVHYDCIYANVAAAAAAGGNAQFGGKRTLSVIGVMLDITTGTGNTELTKFLDYTQNVINANTEATVPNVSHDFTKLLPTKFDYYYYEGGLTTPGCNQIVNWYVLRDVLQIDASQLNKLRSIKDENGAFIVDNYRAVVPIGSRKVYAFPALGAGAGGDVHYRTLDGLLYTFNGSGDYVYLKTKQFDLHVRAHPVNRATALTALAMRDHETGTTLEIWWDGLGSDNVKLECTLENDPTKYSLLDLERTTASKFECHPFHIPELNAPGIFSIIRKDWKHFQVPVKYGGRAAFNVRVPDEWKTEGLAGSRDGDHRNDLCDRTGGLCLSTNVSSFRIHNHGLRWKVQPDEKIFENEFPLKDEHLMYKDLKPSENEIKEAIAHCGNHEACIFDYISTGDPNYASHTLNDHEGLYVGDKLFKN